jgi:4'-phosphopantetheinyl transferase
MSRALRFSVATRRDNVGFGTESTNLSPRPESSYRSPEMGPTEIHVWRFALNASVCPVDCLSADELKRAASFRFDRDRARYLVAHATARGILARYVNEDPSRLRIVVSALGKPGLTPDPHRPDVRFSLSHGGDVGVVAVTMGREVGVDVEPVRDIGNVEDLASMVLSPSERRDRESLPEDLRLLYFLRCWTRKEAFLKARGVGIGDEMPLFHVGAGLDDSATVLQFDASRWYIRTLDVAPGHVCACCTEGHGCEVRLFAVDAV